MSTNKDSIIANRNDSPLVFGEIKKYGFNEEFERQDILQTQKYATALYESILTCNTPMTVGIQGDWGTGKTSMMQMIKAHIDAKIKIDGKDLKSKEIGVLWFNTWQYSLFGRDEFLGIAAIQTILKLMKEQYGDPNKVEPSRFDTIFRHVRKISEVSILGVGVKVNAEDKSNDPESHEASGDISDYLKELRSEFRELVQAVKLKYELDRIIIFVDDLDRLRPVKALELLESFKNFLDVEDCVFVLAVDYEVVQMGMKEKFGVDLQKQSGKSFFDKIIQLPFTMPAASYNLDSYLKKLLADIDLSIETKDEKIAKSYYRSITEVTLLTVGSNPRSIKRVINYISLIKSLNRRKSDKKAASFSNMQIPLLYSIVCMQIAWPEIFDYFIAQPTPDRIKRIEDWNHLDTIPYINRLYNRSPNIDLVKANISSFFDLFYSLIDEDGNGTITTKELKPVHDILFFCNYTQTKEFSEPIDSIIKLVKENGGSDLSEFLDTVFRNSQWKSSYNINFIVSGKRYSTILYKRKQIGSIVTMKTDKLIFRLEVEASVLVESMKEIGFDEASNLIESIDNDSLSGFGRTRIRVDKLSGNEKQKIHFMNCLYDVVRDNYDTK